MTFSEMYDALCEMYDRLRDIEFKGIELSPDDIKARRMMMHVCVRICLDCEIPDYEESNG
jgi:hypothetical protein